MRSTRFAMVALIGAVLLMSSCKQEQVAEKSHPAKLDSTEVKDIMRVTLVPKAAERIGLETGQIREDQVTVDGKTVTRKVMPYGALLYDKKGHTWTFTNPQPLVYVRAAVEVEDVDGDRVILAEGPAAGTTIVTVGATELLGAEHKYGH